MPDDDPEYEYVWVEVRHWYFNEWPLSVEPEDMELYNDILPRNYEYLVSHKDEPGITLMRYVGERDISKLSEDDDR